MRFTRWHLAALSLIVLLLGVVVIAKQVHSAGLGMCLLYDSRDQQDGGVQIIDPASGLNLDLREPPPFANASAGDLSPNNKNMIYLAGPKNGPYSLYVDPSPYKKEQDGYSYCSGTTDNCWYDTKPYSTQAHVLTSGILSGSAPAIWLDNDRLLYSRFTGNRKTLVLGRFDGSILYTLPLTFDAQVGIDVGFYDFDDTHVIFTTIATTGAVDIYQWSFHDNKVQKFSSPLIARYPQIVRSPKGHYLSVIPDRSQPSLMLVFDTITGSDIQLTLPASSELFRITWSPNEQYMMLYPGSCCLATYFAIVDLQGHVFTAQNPYAVPDNSWLPDSSAYIFIAHNGPKIAIAALQGGTGKIEVLLNDSNYFSGPLNNGRLLVEWGGTDTNAVGLLDPQTKQIVTLITGNKLLEVTLLPDKQSVLILTEQDDKTVTAFIADEEGHTRVFLNHMASSLYSQIDDPQPKLLYFADHGGSVSLDSINLDGTEHKVLIDGMDAVEDMSLYTQSGEEFLSFENDPLYYIFLRSSRDGKETVELLNYQTGSHYILAQGHIYDDLPIMNDFNTDGLVPIRWEDTDRKGEDGYSIDGKLIYHLTPPTATPKDDDAITSLAVSPDGRVVAAIPDHSSQGPLALVASDSSWTVLLSDNVLSEDDYRYQLSWSPDSKMLAYVQPNVQGSGITYSIHIVSEDGKPIWKIGNFTQSGTLKWTTCG